ncbi:MAG: thioredoxin family protein [Bacteroidetes bacterium]|nr:thioredoxin family protein [Bacteroidota bacterium]MCW5894531.1 thioredoxin family protein [Bacteroidota bacterium]
MKPIQEMVIFVEPDCVACARVLEAATLLRQQGVVARLIVIDRLRDPESCAKYGVVIYPAVFINGRLAFYGEFSPHDVKRFVKQESVSLIHSQLLQEYL